METSNHPRAEEHHEDENQKSQPTGRQGAPVGPAGIAKTRRRIGAITRMTSRMTSKIPKGVTSACRQSGELEDSKCGAKRGFTLQFEKCRESGRHANYRDGFLETWRFRPER